MEVVTSLVELGIDFVPMPGLAPAFELLIFIWKLVQKASNNKRALRNLVVSSADILTSVNELLSRRKMNEHIRDLLIKLEKVLDDIRLFAEEHVTTNLFKNFIKSADVQGKIESFQSRLQNLSMAFNISAYATIEDQLDKLLQGQRNVSPRLPATPPSTSTRIPKESPTRSKDSKRRRARVLDYEPVRVGSSSSESCKIEVRNKVPILTSRYLDDVDLSDWGLKTTGAKVNKKAGGFDIVWPRDSKTWSWNVAFRTISTSLHNPTCSDWRDIMDIVFPAATSAAAWFLWIEAYASLNVATSAPPPPPSCEVIVRKTYDCWMQKTPTRIERRRPTNTKWTVTLSGHSQSSRAHATHFTYVTGGPLPFTTVYRSGDTIVHERSVRADKEEATTARRFCFNTEDEAQSWYTVWKNCAIDQTGNDDPVQLGLTFRYPCTIQSPNLIPVLSSTVWPELLLRDWGVQKSKSTVTRTDAGFKVTTVTTSWTWIHKGNQVTVYAAISSQPDWIDILEIVFNDEKSSELWFAHLMKYGTVDAPLSRPPCEEHVAVTNTRVCWMQKTDTAIETRTATLDTWKPIFGKYKSIDFYQSHVALMDTSVLPHLRLAHSGHTLALERRASSDDTDVPMSRDYQFSSSAEARTWYEVWKEYLRQRVPLRNPEHVKSGTGYRNNRRPVPRPAG